MSLYVQIQHAKSSFGCCLRRTTPYLAIVECPDPINLVGLKVMATKRKLWSQESMEAATKSIIDNGKELRQAARLYNVPVETLRRRVTGAVPLGCHPGPHTVLSEEKESRIVEYVVNMADMGFGLTRELIKLQKWLENNILFVMDLQGGLSLRPFVLDIQSSPYTHHNLCHTARSCVQTKRLLVSFFSKLGAIYGKLDLFTWPKQIFNVDEETRVSIVHKPGKVLAELGRRNVYALSSAEKGKTHTVLICVSASGFFIPPLMIYLRKQRVPDHMKEGALPNSMFEVSESG